MSRRANTQKPVLSDLHCEPTHCLESGINPRSTQAISQYHSILKHPVCPATHRRLLKNLLVHAKTQYQASVNRQLSSNYFDQAKDLFFAQDIKELSPRSSLQSQQTKLLSPGLQVQAVLQKCITKHAKNLQTVHSTVSGATARLAVLSTTVDTLTEQYRAALAENARLKTALDNREAIILTQSLQIEALHSVVATLNAELARERQRQNCRQLAKKTQQHAIVHATFNTVLASWEESFALLESVLTGHSDKLESLSTALQTIQFSTEMYEDPSECSDTTELERVYVQLRKRYSAEFGSILEGESLEENFKLLCDSYHNQVLASSPNCIQLSVYDTQHIFTPGLTKRSRHSTDEPKSEEDKTPDTPISHAAHAWLLEEYEATCTALEGKEREVAALLNQVADLQSGLRA